MSYGVQIRTNQGLTDISDINVGRYISHYVLTTQNGSLVENDFSDANNLAHISVHTNDGLLPPQITWDENTKTLSWQATTYGTVITSSQISTNWTVIFWRFD